MKNNSFLLFSKACCWTLFNYLQGEQYLQHGCSIFFLDLLPLLPPKESEVCHYSLGIQYPYQAGMNFLKRSNTSTSWNVQKSIPAQYWFALCSTWLARSNTSTRQVCIYKKKILYQYRLVRSKVDTRPILVWSLDYFGWPRGHHDNIYVWGLTWVTFYTPHLTHLHDRYWSRWTWFGLVWFGWATPSQQVKLKWGNIIESEVLHSQIPHYL